MDNLLLNLVFVILALLILLNLARLWKVEADWGKYSTLLLVLALLALLALIGVRIAATGRLPFANMYEFTLLFCAGILAASLVARRGLESSRLDLTVGLLTLLIVSIGSSLPSELRPLMPALQSVWLSAHVATAVIAYGCFALAFCLGILSLTKSTDPGVSLAEIDGRIYRLAVFGFTFLTIVIISGAVWAEEVWGNWWTWDPKETWSLVTWLVYAAYLHARRSYGWKGRKSAWMVVLGFIIVMFTLFGVSILLPGLHSYV